MVKMARRPRFSIVYDPETKRHLAVIEKKHYSVIRKAIEEQLAFNPDVETRNRKPLERDVEFDASWELRFGSDNRFRVFYAIDSARNEVQVLAIGQKRGNRLFIANEEIKI